MFSLLVLTIFILIIIAHSWGFWHVYKSGIGEKPGFEMFGRGLAAGLAGWFWLCAAVAIWNINNNGSWMIVIWLYGVLFFPIIGVILTVLFWWLINKLELETGFWSRAGLGCSIGILMGIGIGFYLDTKSLNSGRNLVLVMSLLFGSMGCASGIMAGESGDDHR